jgi:hypothetical protein
MDKVDSKRSPPMTVISFNAPMSRSEALLDFSGYDDLTERLCVRAGPVETGVKTKENE